MSQFSLKILWLNTNLAIAIDQILGKTNYPLTSYFFWPRNDAWENLKTELESKPWISAEDKIHLLNQVTEIINYWQEEGKNIPLGQVRKQFPHYFFSGSL
jgi:30S ribosomal protein 3|uniref:Probable small ribosomal subunit protein cS23 n=1 Tax=Thorea hispida TaxID=202687 RepID=A0A1C9CAM2_9FLOR|nr:putative ribosomal protein 3 [Thorea hispida]AOM65428.1 putative ribosomal protein 3 [Thorea hispida]ARX95956.1 putative ribosomal protein 3 [Thorea hispida]